ncbi:isoleucine--tRNA ligase [Pseudanabaena mucicola]|uniref:Isoleucine--tRNA ligase n=1 Tax=Pseudanabaena mucicola FACHB-723 TaxID=2692860 RepID=A0ABR8A1H0_9CYAN|nr:isoleucine--tRNA ligase [Pseudanabaena mucicola]MBD2190071.1 isoleucine--tRNA ligase [Pseudanabaena mucicola FACHB-723]
MTSAPKAKSENLTDSSSELNQYKDTVNLPQTDFSMRANAVIKEPEIQKFWQEQEIYEDLIHNNHGDVFTLHDGPPYANGTLHMGHALNKVLKDIINRYKLLRGYKVRYVLGWDCHGLPIELKVLQNIKAEERATLTPLQLRKKAKEFALQTISEQANGFQRWGVWGDYENAYYTLKPEYEAAQIGVFGKMALKGYIYRGLKPVYWSPSSHTALAEAELEYPENHISRSIYVAFPVTKPSEKLKAIADLTNLHAVIWTTTPWTIPANLGISANPHLSYSIVAAGDKNYIVATELVEKLAETFEQALEVKYTFKGDVLEGTVAKHPIVDRPSPIVLGDHVTAESGTGLVHTAPNHGQDDFVVGKKYHLGMISLVDDRGIFNEDAGEELAGLSVLKEGNAKVVEILTANGTLIKEEAYNHKYPYDWRTKKPVIVRATEQWFASVDGFREDALKSIKEVNWIPAIGENRITSMVQERSDWCISRQRTWGVPIPVFYDEETNEPLLTEETVTHIQDLIREHGSDVWWEREVEDLLPESYKNNGRKYRKGTDTMDVWFDSGSSWAGVLGGESHNSKLVPYALNYPADIYLEGSDQHRGWFQSSLLTSVATNGYAPYKTVLTHGFVLDEKGQKMSKSLGNIVDPMVVINGGKDQKKEPPYGADVIRLWAASVDYNGDVPIGKTILAQMSDVSRKIRNTARFLLSNLFDFDPAKDTVAYADLSESDRYILHRLSEVTKDITEAYEKFQFSRFFQTIQNFCTVDLSNFYLDIAKDRLYISAPNVARRRSCQTVLMYCLEMIAKAIAPVLAHTAEDIWQHLPYPTPSKSVFQAGWFTAHDEWQKPELATKWEYLREVRSEVNKVLESARTGKLIGAPLEAKVLLTVSDPTQKDYLASLGEELRYLFIVSQAEIVKKLSTTDFTGESTNLKIAVVKADGEKCPRCWNYSTHIGESAEHPHICDRCVGALAGTF